ncbi:MAG: efflux RND transporter periplasmic adaptor subunit [Gemmatimonadota bacterium]|nr:efflux RND transporter periplasmic adaptor subunit [Gemmatimonadota bacterium]
MGRGAPASAAEEGAAVDTLHVERRQIGASVLATGVIRPQVGARVAVGSRVSGVLARLHVTVGDEVPAGELLAELDPTEFEARLAQALASLETARVERDFAERQLERAGGLVRTQVIAQAEYDDAERLFMAADARVREAEASARTAEIQLGYTRIRAPISGVVATVTTQVGETVAASFAAPTFVTIIDLERLEVWAYVDETDIGRVEAGQMAAFTVDTYPGEELEGVVTAIRPQAEIQDNVVNYVTVIEIADPGDWILRPEMTTTVNIRLGPRDDALAVPNAAIGRDATGTWVLVPGAAGPVRRTIRPGRRGRTHTEVLSGLEEGEEVLVTGDGQAR